MSKLDIITDDFYDPSYPIDNSLRRRPTPVTYPKVNIALLSPRKHAGQSYKNRQVIFTNNEAYVRLKKQEGWEAMLKDHYDARVEIDKGPPHVDYSWVRKIVEPIYAKIRRKRK